ncbi:aldehyde dehydrogenase family protein [Rhodococcus sp. NPDC057529]|uniref:aldehyde dehydrogenase family protein n=1 Tax=Rhodococcus sp. NPDC057529 TaxID=3346158 RepID=UPI00366DF736
MPFYWKVSEELTAFKKELAKHTRTERIMNAYRMYIDGEWVQAHSGRTFDSIDPWTQKPFAVVPEGDESDVDRAVAAALTAFRESGWTESPYERARILRAFADLIDRDAERLAHIESQDNGKIIREELGMYGSVSGYFRFAASVAETRTDAVPVGSDSRILSITRRVPFGVVGIQSPWNTPGVILAQSAASALAAGNTLVIKPSEIAPVSTLVIAELAHEAGIPPGVFNVVTGFGDPVGARLCSHPDVSKLVFTGSPEGGRRVARQAAERLVPVVMELGGKSANVVFADADVEEAALAVARGFTAAAGQSCMCGGRAIIEDSIHDEVMEKVVAYLDQLVIGNPAEAATDLGPTATPTQLDRIRQYVELAGEEGAHLLYGGEVLTEVHPQLIRPAVFTDVTPTMRIFQEEVFGPVLAVSRFKTESEAVDLANGTQFGLSLAVWSKNLDRAHRVSNAMRAGVVWVNQYRRGDPAFAMGGIGESGYGRLGGIEGYEEMTYPKSIQISIDHSHD